MELMDLADYNSGRLNDDGQDDGDQSGQCKIISSLYQCNSRQAQFLCIYDVAKKLKKSGEYDIGGTYGPTPEIWFYFTTSVCPGYSYLLNLFICHRRPGNIEIMISSCNKLPDFISQKDESIHMTDILISYAFRSIKPDENYYIKTFCFSKGDLEKMKSKVLYIPIRIKTNVKATLDYDVIRRIKLSHDFGSLLKQKETADFTLESMTGKKYEVHKIILAAHSPVLRSAIKNASRPSLSLKINDSDMKLLLQFLYTGTIKDLPSHDCLNLLEIAGHYELKNLFNLIQYSIGENININNAVEMLVLSEKYKLCELQKNIFTFIKDHPAVMKTDGWKNLDSVHITKKMLQFMYKATNM